MSIEDVDLQKFYFQTSNACLQLTTYMEFSNGTKGCVLILNFNNTDSQILLINSPERAEGGKQFQKNTLSNSETDILLAYRKECEENHDGYYCSSPEMYDRFGVVVLTGQYLCAHIADYFCHYLNVHYNKVGNPYGNWSTDRGKLLMHNATYNYTLHEIEEEIQEFLSDECAWARTITWQVLKRFGADLVLDKIIQVDKECIKKRETYIGWLEREEIKFKLCFAERLLRECPINGDWRHVLEDTLRCKKDLLLSFQFSNYGIQEIVGLYALCKHHYTHKPDTMEIIYDDLPTKERITIYDEYSDACVNEMLAKLNAEDDPLRAQLPDEKEAEEKSKLRIAQLVSKQPICLTDEQKELYTKYAQGYCMERKIPYSTESSVVIHDVQEVHPKVFISYSWDGETHENWVLKLATDLRCGNGIDVILDKWEMKLGKLLPDFMAHAVTDSDRVICVMTPNYKKKSDGLTGGVGLEYSIISAEIQKNVKTDKFIPLFRSGEDAPTFLAGRDFVDMRDDSKYSEAIEELVRDIFNKPKYKKPQIGAIPKLD